MYDFEYHKPASVADAVKLLAADPDAKAVSGGHTLIPALSDAGGSDIIELPISKIVH